MHTKGRKQLLHTTCSQCIFSVREHRSTLQVEQDVTTSDEHKHQRFLQQTIREQAFSANQRSSCADLKLRRSAASPSLTPPTCSVLCVAGLTLLCT